MPSSLWSLACKAPPDAAVMKRAVWDYEMEVRLVKSREPGASADQRLEVITFGVQQLLHLQFFANLPLPEDADVVSVDLVRTQCSAVHCQSGSLSLKQQHTPAGIRLCPRLGMRQQAVHAKQLLRTAHSRYAAG